MKNRIAENGTHPLITIEPNDYIPYVSGILWAVDTHMRYLDIEGQKLKEWNLSKDAVIGKSVQEFHQEDADGTNITHHQLALTQGKVTYQVTFAGSSYDCKLHYMPEREIIVGVATDITREKGLHQQIADQEDTLLELSALAVPILENAVVVPILGQLTVQRTKHMQEHILDQVYNMAEVHTVILDFSGVTDARDQSEELLQSLYQSLKLLGIRTILTGVTPKLAQALVNNGTTLAFDRVYVTLKMAILALIDEQ